jgi:hypothetical protein
VNLLPKVSDIAVGRSLFIGDAVLLEYSVADKNPKVGKRDSSHMMKVVLLEILGTGSRSAKPVWDKS